MVSIEKGYECITAPCVAFFQCHFHLTKRSLGLAVGLPLLRIGVMSKTKHLRGLFKFFAVKLRITTGDACRAKPTRSHVRPQLINFEKVTLVTHGHQVNILAYSTPQYVKVGQVLIAIPPILLFVADQTACISRSRLPSI